MKRLKVFILILLISAREARACTDYFPFQDGARFSIFDTHCFGFSAYNPFFYSVHLYAPSFYDSLYLNQPGKITIVEKPNVKLWRERCRNIPSEKDVYNAVYGDDDIESTKSSNSFVRYLLQHKDSEAIAYLNFAKHNSGLADFVADPWERNRNMYEPARRRQVNSALELAENSKDADIRLRYAFLAIRTAYYSSEPAVIKNTYEEFFATRSKRNIIDYWAMYFRAITEPDSVMGNYLEAQVFVHAPDKRFMCSMQFERNIAIEKVLALAKNNSEKSAIWLLYGIRNPGRALESMQHLSALNENAEGLDFLLLREVNKLEDWIYSPYYTSYAPSVQKDGAEKNYSSEAKRARRIQNDRVYAAQVLAFVQAKKSSRKSNSLVWQSAAAYLLLMTQNDSAALQEISTLETRHPAKAVLEQLELIKAMCIMGLQPEGNAVIPDELKALLQQEEKKGNYRFVFALARELEFKGNTDDAALLLSKINPERPLWTTTDWEKVLAWQRRNAGAVSWYGYSFTDYFDYMDAVYSPEQVKTLIAAIERKAKGDAFEQWECNTALKDLSRLYDLLGTKYMRIDELQPALSSFEKVNDTLWTSEYAPFMQYLDANPFYTDFYNEHTHTDADTIRFTKTSLVRQLIKDLALAEDSNNRDRDYYYFLVANCYLNMTCHGNSWIMKRYWWSSSRQDVEYAGGNDFNECKLAKKYYLKAKSVSRKKEFAALCLRMAGRCEKYRLTSQLKGDDYYLSESDKWMKVFKQNIYYRKLKKQYPAYYDELISNCNSFEQYFAERR